MSENRYCCPLLTSTNPISSLSFHSPPPFPPKFSPRISLLLRTSLPCPEKMAENMTSGRRHPVALTTASVLRRLLLQDYDPHHHKGRGQPTTARPVLRLLPAAPPSSAKFFLPPARLPETTAVVTAGGEAPDHRAPPRGGRGRGEHPRTVVVVVAAAAVGRRRQVSYGFTAARSNIRRHICLPCCSRNPFWPN